MSVFCLYHGCIAEVPISKTGRLSQRTLRNGR